MLPKLTPQTNQYGKDVSKSIPKKVGGVFDMDDASLHIWEKAKQYLAVRDNDAHTLYSYGIARSLCATEPTANSEIVLAAILLHDTGWSKVPEHLVLSAISPTGGDRDLVLWHEREGILIAQKILGELGYDQTFIDEVKDIIFTHDSVKEAKSINDAIVKDADKLWRITSHGIDTVMEWFGLDRETANRLCSWRVHEYLHTPAAKNMALALSAVASVDTMQVRVELG